MSRKQTLTLYAQTPLTPRPKHTHPHRQTDRQTDTHTQRHTQKHTHTDTQQRNKVGKINLIRDKALRQEYYNL